MATLASRAANIYLPLPGLLLALLLTPASPSSAQSGPFSSSVAALSEGRGPLLAQAPPPGNLPPSTVLPTDATPLIFSGERGFLSRDLRFAILKRLPERLWFSMNTEASQRLETNPFFTTAGGKTDYAFRVLPNITLGYNVLKRTSVYCNWFLIKDLFARNAEVLNFPTTQSLSLGFRHDMPIGRKTNLQFDFQARELWQTARLRQADLLPAINITRVVTPSFILFGSTLLQMRGRNYFVAPTRELDPFYSVGFLYRRGQWNFTATTTFVTNFRSPPFHGSIPRQGNVSMISDYEISRPISKKFPGVVGFVRAEPVWNWRSKNTPGLSGFDFRLFTGIRLAVNKQAYNASIDEMREQIMEMEKEKRPSEEKPKEKEPAAEPGG